MDVFVHNNVDYTPLMWWLLAIYLGLPTVGWLLWRFATRQIALQRVRPMIKNLLTEEGSALTVRDYIKLVERVSHRRIWLSIHTPEALLRPHKVEEKEVKLVY